MQKLLNNLPEELQDLIHLASDISVSNNLPAYLVGGFVRDLILGVKNLDIDIVVENEGIKFAEDFANILKAKLIRHRRFGTATIVLENGLKIDIATLRKEYYPQPASLPHVISGTLKDDLARRDFTINAMAISIEKANFGKLIDFFNGAQDLVQKKIRILHNSSFIDDPTRILRAVRFESRYDFKIEPLTVKYIKEALNLKMLEKVQAQRLRDELSLILKERQPLKPLKRIQNLAGFNFISPHLNISKNTGRLLSLIGRQVLWFNGKFPRHRHLDAWLIYFMGLTDSLSRQELKSICKKFVFRKGEEKRVLAYKRLSHKFIQELSSDKIKPSRIFHLLESLSYENILLIKAKYSRQYIQRGGGIPHTAGKGRNIQKHIEDFFIVYNGMRIHTSGEDLHRLGITPGPAYQKIFRKVLDAKLNGLVNTKEEELALSRKFIKEMI